MMKKKVITLIILGSFFPFFFTGCESKSGNSQQFQIIQKAYETFAKNIKENGTLLTQLKEESETQPIPIEILQTTKNFQEVSNNFNNFQSKIKEFENQVENEEIPIDDDKKEKIKSYLGKIKNQFNTTKQSPTIDNIIKLFEDGKLEKTEICNDIQIPLGVFDSKEDENCGKFNIKTYIELKRFLSEQNKIIEENIEEINRLVNSNLYQNNKLLIAIITSSVLGLGIIGSFIWIYLLSKKNKQIINEILSQKEKIKNLENKNETQKSDIQQLENKINELGKLIEREYSQIQLHLGELDYKINDLSSNSNQNRENPQQLSYSQSTYEQTYPPLPEDVRLTNLYRENPQGLLQNAIRVSMTKETVNKVLAGTWEGLIELESNSRQGEFYIVSSNSGESYLFLDPNTLFNTQILQQINKSQLFICNGSLSQKLKGGDINIIKPAIVEKNIENNWVFVQSGEIDLL
ncbi:hypothetical protein [Geminocystis sp.]|uniref:hypothetical protein n=1 Tax=Geminocystis sp. TaxID=2664100 RepID=UPI003593E191